MPPMNESNPIRHDVLIGELLAFHRELLRHRAAVEAAVGLPDPVAVTGGAGEGGAARTRAARGFSRRRSELARRRLTDLELLGYREAQCDGGAADDLFLHGIQWPGLDASRQDVLEFRLFGTRVAGERFFENIKTIVQGRGGARWSWRRSICSPSGSASGRMRAEERQCSTITPPSCSTPFEAAVPTSPIPAMCWSRRAMPMSSPDSASGGAGRPCPGRW